MSHHVPKRLTEEVLAEIKGKAEERLAGVEIERHLEKLMAEGKEGFDHVPHLRTIQQIAKPFQNVDQSGPWHLTDPDPVDTGVVMRVLADVARCTGGRRRYLTRAEAGLVSRISEAAPKLAADFGMYKLAREYLRRKERNESTEDLDLLIAFAAHGYVPVQAYKRFIGTAPPKVLLMSPKDYTQAHLEEGGADARAHTKKE